MATKTLSAALSELAADGTISGSERLIVADTDGVARTITVDALINKANVPTRQTSAVGTNQNYIYSDPTGNYYNAVVSGSTQFQASGGKMWLRLHFWANGTGKYYVSREIPLATSSYNGLISNTTYSALNNATIYESGSTTEAVNINYTNLANGGSKTLTISKATTAKAGVMTADQVQKLVDLETRLAVLEAKLNS